MAYLITRNTKFPYQVRDVKEYNFDTLIEFCTENFLDNDWIYVQNSFCFKLEKDRVTFLEKFVAIDINLV